LLTASKVKLMVTHFFLLLARKLVMPEIAPSFSKPSKKNVDARIIVEVKNKVFKFESIVIGKVGVFKFEDNEYTESNE